MTKWSGKFGNVYSQIAWRGSSVGKELTDADAEPALAAFQHEDKRAAFLLGSFSAESSGGFGGGKFVPVVSGQFRLMMLLTSSLPCRSVAAHVMARAVFGKTVM